MKACGRTIKLVHALLQTLVGVFIVLAIVFAVEYKADQHGAHFWSVHAWIGAGAIALYCLQYPLGDHPAGALLPPWSCTQLVAHQRSMRARRALHLLTVVNESSAQSRLLQVPQVHSPYRRLPASLSLPGKRQVLSVP